MGAVKTNRRGHTLYILTGFPMVKHGIYEKLHRLDKRVYSEYKLAENWNSEINNRRKMAGEPLIRRAKS